MNNKAVSPSFFGFSTLRVSWGVSLDTPEKLRKKLFHKKTPARTLLHRPNTKIRRTAPVHRSRRGGGGELDQSWI